MTANSRKTGRANRHVGAAWGLCCVLVLSITQRVAADEGPSGQWRVSAGMIRRTLRNMEFRAPTQSSANLVPTAAARGIHGPRANVGALGAFADRDYDDGFVYGDAGTNLDGDTWYWGYEGAGQVVGDTLTFRASSGTAIDVRRQVETGGFQANDRDNDGVGVMLQAERLWSRSERMAFGVVLQASHVQFTSSFRGTTFRDEQSWTAFSRTVQDTYALQGVVPPPPPYSGDSAGPGPVINNIPDSRSLQRRARDSGGYEAYNQMRSRLEIDLTTISVGAVVDGRIGRIRTALSAGPSLNLVAMEASHHEVLRGGAFGAPSRPLEEWRYSDTQTRVEPGAFAQVSLGLALTDQVAVDIFGRADWVSRLSGHAGPANYKANLDGHSVGVALTWLFSANR